MANIATIDHSVFLAEWRQRMYHIVRAKYPSLSKKKINEKLDQIIQRKLSNPKVMVINNYTNQTVRTDILSLIDLIEDNHLIISGGGCLFHQHATKKNVLIGFILYVMEQRKYWKAQRKKYDENSYEYLMADIQQLLFKLIINSLYGCLGYPGFTLYNVFLAEAITNQGKHIITSAINGFEQFLGDNQFFDTESELYSFLVNNYDDYQEIKDSMDISNYKLRDPINQTLRRLIEKCTFKFDQKFIDRIGDQLRSYPEELVTMIFYKNNLIEFCRNSSIMAILKIILTENGPIMTPSESSLKDDSMVKLTQYLWSELEKFVFYNHPIFDRVRKAMYQDKTRSLYTDTDSVFISLDHLVQFCQCEVLMGKSEMDEDTLSFSVANYMMIFVNYVVDKVLKTLCYSCNITEEWAKKLSMKNEFFFKKIVFMDKKKRYISLSLLQEGKLLGGGKGKSEIKGLDFIKSTTKEFLRDFYTKLCLDDILYPAEIQPSVVFHKMVQLRDMIKESVRSGDMKFFKQSAVKSPDLYKNPFQTQGVTAIILWNALCPDHAMEFPADVNIVPIKSLRWEAKVKGEKAKYDHPLKVPEIAKFAEKYPESYKRLYHDIYSSDNENLRHMGMSYIATPKNPNIPVPDVIYELIDYDKIVSDAIGLFQPVMTSIGIKSLDVSSTVSNMSNMVDL